MMTRLLVLLLLIATPAWAAPPSWAHDVKKTVTKSVDFEEVVVEVDGVKAGYRYDHGKRYDLKWERDPKALGLKHRLHAHEITQPFPPELDPLPSSVSVPNDVAPAGMPPDVAIVIDVNYFYTIQAANKIGGESKMPAFAALSCALATQAYANSGMPQVSLRCLGPFKASYADTTNLNDAYNWMNAAVGAGAPELAAKYSLTGADLTHLVIANAGGNCGLGTLNAVPSTAYSTSDINCANSNLSFPHESVGHNVGMHHDPANAACGALVLKPSGLMGCPSGYNYGHAWPIGAVKWRDIMAYPGAGGTRITQFSNPNILYQGLYPTGIVNERDNMRVAAARASVVASFRTAVVTTHKPPSTPTTITVSQ